jgi:hypothetical protein
MRINCCDEEDRPGQFALWDAQAEVVYERLLREGYAGVWAALEDRYRELFELTAVVADEARQT